MSSKHCIHTSLFSCHDDQYYKHPRATVNRHACPRRQLLPITGLSRRRSVSPRSESQYGYNSNTLFRRAMLCKRDAQCVSINLALMNVESLKFSMSTYEHQHFPNLGSKKALSIIAAHTPQASELLRFACASFSHYQLSACFSSTRLISFHIRTV